jgi:hypothetical protein
MILLMIGREREVRRRSKKATKKKKMARKWNMMKRFVRKAPAVEDGRQGGDRARA